MGLILLSLPCGVLKIEEEMSSRVKSSLEDVGEICPSWKGMWNVKRNAG